MRNNNSPSSQKEELLQAIIHDMKQQGFLDDFTDEETGEALLEIQFSDETVVCKVEKTNGEDSQE